VSGNVGFAEKGYRRVLRMLARELDCGGHFLGRQFSCADIMLGTSLT